MTMNPLPPQAYTKDTLLKAYQWLTCQSASIKEMATSPDILVSLYLKATRDGDSALDRPSIQNFKNELKSLAGMMGELDRPQQTVHATVMNQAPQQQQVFTSAQPMPNMAPPPPPPSHTQQTIVYVNTPNQQAPAPENGTTPSLLDTLDCASRAMIQEVKAEFNLSCEKEALRMLIKMGYTRSQVMFKA
ncbi:hypothetical protein D3C87_176850 [compost metagenome]